jgi:hypothetical protein
MAAKKGFLTTEWGERGTVERVLLIVGGGVAAFIAYRNLKGLLGFVRETGQNIQTGAELQLWQNVGQTPSYQNTQYQIFADTLYTAMDGWGTDEDSVKTVMQAMNNNADVLKLIQVFGIRDGYGLAGWIADDFSASDKEKYINQVLRVRGITYQF